MDTEGNLDYLLGSFSMNMEESMKKYILKIPNINNEKIKKFLDFIKVDENKLYTLKDYRHTIDSLIKKIDINNELFDICNNIFSTDKTFEEVLNLYNSYKMFLPLIIHYNYQEYLTEKFKDKKKIIEEFDQISDIVSKGENIHTYMFDNHFWDLNMSYCMLSTYYPSVELNKDTNKKKKIKFTNINSKNSFIINNHYIFNNIMQKTHIKYFDKTIIKYIFKSMLINLFSNDEDKIKKAVEFMKKNNLKVSEIPKLIKISESLFLKELFESNIIKKKIKGYF